MIQQQLLLTMHRRQRGVGGGGGDAGDVNAAVQNSSWTSKSTRRFVLLHRLRLKIVWWLPFLLLLLQQLLQTALNALYSHYEGEFDRWKRAGIGVPPMRFSSTA